MSKRINTGRIKQLRSYERYVPRQPPTGNMRHLNAKEISRCKELIPRSMDEKACKVETDALLRCWQIHGAEDVDETHPCNAVQDSYLGCVRKNVGRGLMRNKDIGGEYIYTYMWQFQEPLRKDNNLHVSHASKATHRSKGTNKRRQWWQGGKPRKHRKY
eukprot:615541_1